MTRRLQLFLALALAVAIGAAISVAVKAVMATARTPDRSARVARAGSGWWFAYDRRVKL